MLRQYWPHLATAGTLAVLWLYPCPPGLDPKAWHMLAIFVATIVGFITKPYPMAVVAIMAIAFSALTKTVGTTESLSAFGDTTIWLIVSAFFLSRAFIKTGLGNRIAYIFMGKLGKTTLGLAYGVTLTNLCLAPVVPSNTARLGGILFPLQMATAFAYDSDPAKGTGRRIGSFLMASAFQSNLVISAMFLTAMAANPMIARFAGDVGVNITWASWFIGASVPGFITLVLVPLVLYVVWPPEIKKSPEAVKIAKEKLAAMGAVSRQEWIMLGVFIILLGLWTVGSAFNVNATNAALVGLAILLATRVLTWSDLAAEKGAWNTLTWFAALIMMANALNKLGFIAWMSNHLAAVMGGMHWSIAFVLLTAIYVYAHYFFASQTAHVAAMFTAFLAVLIALGTPPVMAALGLGYCSNLMGGLTHYGNGSAPIFLDSGFIPLKPWWLMGVLFSAIFLFMFLIVGPMWWRMIGYI
jgi:DASS family divalent anion:Na+ symporter